MQTIKEYQEQLFNKIPITQSLGAEILELSENKTLLHFPLQENINYEGTAFGGSLNTACILACYLMTHHWLKINQINFSSLVIQKSEIQYHKPTRSNFQTQCFFPELEIQQRFLKQLNKRKIARLNLKSHVMTADSKEPHVSFDGHFVVQL